MKPKNSKTENWEYEFNYLTGNLVHQESLLEIEKIKSFIKSLLAQQKEEIKERVENIWGYIDTKGDKFLIDRKAVINEIDKI